MRVDQHSSGIQVNWELLEDGQRLLPALKEFVRENTDKRVIA